MKTTDLIALILYELGEGDKYGFELTKSIETLSNGKIVIKQATLYSVFKKLEKSKFISSYWKDSEIGGKRHYYKLTENGNLQLSTMPSVDIIVQNALTEPIIENDQQKEEAPILSSQNVKNEQQENAPSNKLSIMDLLDETNKPTETTNNKNTEVFETAEQQSGTEPPTLKETVLPTEEVFKSSSIDNLTESEINSSNATLLRDNAADKTEKFAENENVAKFANNQPYTPLDLSNKLRPQKETFEPREQIQPKKVENDEIKFVDYVNFKKDANYIQAKRFANNMWYRLLCSSAYLVFVLAVCAVVANKTNFSVMGNVCLILGIILLIFTPTIYAYNYVKFKTKCQEGKFNFDIKKRIIIAICIILAIILVVIIINIAMGKSSVSSLLGVNNFSNIYAPILISSVVLADFLFSCLFLKNSKN